MCTCVQYGIEVGYLYQCECSNAQAHMLPCHYNAFILKDDASPQTAFIFTNAKTDYPKQEVELLVLF